VNANLLQLSAIARKAVQAGDWATVRSCAKKLIKQDKKGPEGYFLSGLCEKSSGRSTQAVALFSLAIKHDAGRYDAAIELANQHVMLLRNGEATTLLKRYESRLDQSPLYLDMAAMLYTRLGLHAKAWPLLQKANALQPELDQFQANLAACAVYLGKISEAREIYLKLLQRYPNHQRNHYELSRLEKARDAAHVEQMLKVLAISGLSDEKNIFMYYALGKELEDLERWSEAFHYYTLAGDAVTRVSTYDVATDIKLIETIIKVCNADWLADGIARDKAVTPLKTPIFIVGLPRTGTTLTERIVSSHSEVESAEETFLLQMMIQRASGIQSREGMTVAMVEAAARKDIRLIADGYMNAIDYKLSDRPYFIEKLPENYLYLGFIAKAYPNALIIHLKRNPMDSCFAMFKQSFFKYAYTLDSLGQYYVAYDRLRSHWQDVLADRVIELEYESLVADQEGHIRGLLDKLGLDFDQACLDFDQNVAPSATASAVQVREKAHTRSVDKWKKFESELSPLKNYLQKAGIQIS